MLISTIIGFAPALYLIWFSLNKYAYPHVQGSLFEDRRVFFMLAVGMVLGSLLFVMELSLYSIFYFENVIYFELFILIYVLAFPLLEDLAKFIILNFKGYRGRFDSTFYGVALGAGYSATSIVGIINFSLNNTLGSINIITWIGLIILSASTCLIHVSVGATIGSATGQNLGLRGIPLAVIPHIIFNMLMYPMFATGQIWYSLILVLPVAVYIYWGVYTKTIPECLPSEVQKEVRRDTRRRTYK